MTLLHPLALIALVVALGWGCNRGSGGTSDTSSSMASWSIGVGGASRALSLSLTSTVKKYMAAVATTVLEAIGAGWQIELIVNHQDFLGGDLEVARKTRYRLAAAVHESGGNQQANIVARQAGTPCKAKELGFRLQ